MANTDVGGAAAKKKRVRVTNSDWLDAEGNIVDDIRKAEGVRIAVVGVPTPFQVIFADEYNEDIRRGLLAFGAKTNLTNAGGGKQGDDFYEDLMARHETFAAGEWFGGGEQGPRVSQLAEALVAVFAKGGQTKDVDAVKATLLEKGEQYRKDIAARKDVALELARIKREAAERRESELREKMGEGEPEALPDL